MGTPLNPIQDKAMEQYAIEHAADMVVNNSSEVQGMKREMADRMSAAAKGKMGGMTKMSTWTAPMSANYGGPKGKK